MARHHIIRLDQIRLDQITLHYITLHYVTLRYVTLHYITLHYLHYITLQTYILMIVKTFYQQQGVSEIYLQHSMAPKRSKNSYPYKKKGCKTICMQKFHFRKKKLFLKTKYYFHRSGDSSLSQMLRVKSLLLFCIERNNGRERKKGKKLYFEYKSNFSPRRYAFSFCASNKPALSTSALHESPSRGYHRHLPDQELTEELHLLIQKNILVK